MGCCVCSKKLIFLFIFNTVCALTGLAVLASAVHFYHLTCTVNAVLHTPMTGMFVIMMALGAITVIIAIDGCCGTINKDPSCNTTYTTLLSIVVVCQVVLAGYIYHYQNSSADERYSNANKVFDDYENNRWSVDIVQSNFHCCGMAGWPFRSLHNLPASCCARNQSGRVNLIGRAGVSTCTVGNAYEQGCFRAVEDVFRHSSLHGTLTLVASSIVELMCVMNAQCFYFFIKSKLHLDHKRSSSDTSQEDGKSLQQPPLPSWTSFFITRDQLPPMINP